MREDDSSSALSIHSSTEKNTGLEKVRMRWRRWGMRKWRRLCWLEDEEDEERAVAAHAVLFEKTQSKRNGVPEDDDRIMMMNVSRMAVLMKQK
jgi:hypothetical protein